MEDITLYNNTAPISFCDKQTENIKRDAIKEKIINYINEKYNMQIVSDLYKVLKFQTLKNVSYHQHIISPLTTGNPYLMFLTIIDNKNTIIMIDRKIKKGYNYPKMHIINYKFDDIIYKKDTIFNCELIRNNDNNWQILLTDILVFDGQQQKTNVIKRFELIHNILNTHFEITDDIPCPIEIKRLFLYNQINYILNTFIPSLNYKCAGIVFYSIGQYSNYLYLFNRDTEMISILKEEEINEQFKITYPDLWLYKYKDDRKLSMNQDHNYQIDMHTDKSTNITADDKSHSINPNNNVGGSHSNVINNNTMIFKMIKTNITDIYTIYCIKDENLYDCGNPAIPNITLSLYLQELYKKKDAINMVCRYSLKFNKWIPINPTDTETISKYENVEYTILLLKRENMENILK